jgi:hypothetical protein
MDISSLLQAILDPRLNRSAWLQEIVKPGDVLNLKIIEVRGDQRALVDLGKFRALAEVKFPVKAGAELLAKVSDTDGQLRLQVVDPESKGIAGRKNMLGRLEILSFDIFSKIQSDIKQAVRQVLNLPGQQLPPEQIQRALTMLDTHFESIDLKKPVTKWLPLLKSYVENAGFLFEKRIADIINKSAARAESEVTRQLIRSPQVKTILAKDLKPILLMLKGYLETPDSGSKLLDTKSLSSVKGSIDMLLADILNQQTRATQKLDLPDPYHVFSFTLPLKEDHHKAKLKFYYPKKKTGSKVDFRISLLLDMDKLGEVRTDFHLNKKELAITFFVQDESHKQIFDANRDEISERLAPSFEYLILKTIVSAKKIQDFHRQDLDLGSDKQIDLRI